MGEHCHVVPWYNSEEWHKVYEEILNPALNKESALNTLLVWKARCPNLPSGIESTLSLLQVHIEDIKQSPGVADDQLLRLAYSSAIMRFVNHMLDSETMKGSSLYKAAKNLGVPDWIVDLRHDTAHSNNLPRITLLREACTISLQWLQQNYWEKYKPNIFDYISGQKSFRDENKIIALINLCTSLSICAHPSCKIKNLSEIPNMDMKESIVSDIKDLFEDLIDLSNLKTVSIRAIINVINKQSRNILKSPEVSAQYVNEAILGEDSMFLSKDLLYHFSNNEFRHKNRLKHSYIQCFEVLLTFLHTNELLLEFILALIKITQTSDNHFKARLAALWLAEILQALKKSQDFSQKLKKMLTAENKNSKKKRDLKQLYSHWFPNPKGYDLLLDLQKPIPKQLLDINYIQPIIAAYNPYLIYFIKNLLGLLEPSIPTFVAQKVCKLAELISTPEKFSLSDSTIYTADDLKPSDDDDVEITDVILPEEVNTVIHGKEKQEKIINTIWKVGPDNHNWSSCPIGQLPWQLDNNNLMEISHD